MQFTISKNENGWNISPLSGTLEGRVVATAEGVNLQGVKFAGKHILGGIKALWGATVLLEEIYADPETLRGLHLGGCFDTNLDEKLVLDYDGFLDRTNTVMKGAKKLLAIGNHIYARGAR